MTKEYVVRPQVFISYSSSDQKVAQTICTALESRSYPCWISSRDIGPGENFQEAIVKAIRSAKVMLLVFTGNANNSNEIKKELVLAGRHHVTVIPVRVEDVVPSDALAYELATRQWIDLFKDWEREIDRLASQVGSILAEGTASSDGDVDTAKKQRQQPPLQSTNRSFSLRPLILLPMLLVIALGVGGAYLYTRTVVAPLPPASLQASRPAEPQPAQPSADDSAWLGATNTDSVEAFRQYLDHFRAGTHVAAADARHFEYGAGNRRAQARLVGQAPARRQRIIRGDEIRLD